MKNRPALLVRLGCGHLIASLIVACVLLTLNGLVVTSLYGGWANRLSDFWKNPRIAQAVLFLGPLLLLTLQLWAMDVLVDYVRPLPSKSDAETPDRSRT
jgi:hypothetical protein